MRADVQRLCARLAAIPAVYASSVDPRSEAGLDVRAVVADLYRARGLAVPKRRVMSRFVYSSPSRAAYLEWVLLGCWLLHDRELADATDEALRGFLVGELGELARVAKPRAFVEDPERREELVRRCLAALGRLPVGETVAQAEDRLASIDSIKRAALLAAARERELERRREELARLRAQEEEERRKAARTTFED